MYFIDIDTTENKVYLVPLKQVKDYEYVILCHNRYEAEKLKAKLTIGKVRAPIKNDQFEVVETIKKLGKSLTVYTFKE